MSEWKRTLEGLKPLFADLQFQLDKLGKDSTRAQAFRGFTEAADKIMSSPLSDLCEKKLSDKLLQEISNIQRTSKSIRFDPVEELEKKKKELLELQVKSKNISDENGQLKENLNEVRQMNELLSKAEYQINTYCKRNYSRFNDEYTDLFGEALQEKDFVHVFTDVSTINLGH